MEKLSPSARLVLRIITERKTVKFKELKEETGLATRTIRQALKELREAGLIKVLPCLDDARERLYTVQECYKLKDNFLG